MAGRRGMKCQNKENSKTKVWWEACKGEVMVENADSVHADWRLGSMKRSVLRDKSKTVHLQNVICGLHWYAAGNQN